MVAFLTCVYFDQYLDDDKGTIPVKKQNIFIVLTKAGTVISFGYQRKGLMMLQIIRGW